MTTKVFNLIILDESGSMMSIRKEAVDSVNETFQTIRAAQEKHEDQEHYITFVSFNDDVSTVYDCVPCAEVKDITGADYRPRCCTALYDAMGQSITALASKVVDGDRVLVTVVTDGCENSSREYSGKAVKALVEDRKEAGWVFAYIGANHDVEEVAATISITNTMKFHATSAGMKHMSAGVSGCRMRFFDRIAEKDFNAAEENGNFFNE